MKHGRRKQERQRRKGTSGSSTASATSTASAWTTQSAEAAEGPAGGTRIEPWWKREPERLQFELEELDAAGIEYQVNEAAKARGSLIIDLEIILADGEKVLLQARFPDLYPYFRFEILAPELDLPYHQHPFGKQLCILGRATRTWNTTNTLAEFIKTQVPRVLATARMVSLEEASGLEEHLFEANGIPVAPIVLGMVLGPIVEQNFMVSMIKSEWDLTQFFTRPAAAVLAVLTILTWLAPVYPMLFRRLSR